LGQTVAAIGEIVGHSQVLYLSWGLFGRDWI